MKTSKRLGRPISGNSKVKISIRLAQEMLDWIDAQGGDRTAVVVAALEWLRSERGDPLSE